jgi:hypothetical protein
MLPWLADADSALLPAVPIEARDEAVCAMPTPLSPERIHVLDAWKHLSAEPDERLAFVMLNGENEGVTIRLPPTEHRCDGAIARVAATLLAPERVRSGAGTRRLFLLSVTGRPAVDVAGSSAPPSRRLVHLLFDGETWVWPGVRVGFEWRVAGMAMRTISLRPKVISVSDVLDNRTIEGAISRGREHMYHSPERHYSPGCARPASALERRALYIAMQPCSALLAGLRATAPPPPPR